MGLTNGLIVWGFLPQLFENWVCFRFQLENGGGEKDSNLVVQSLFFYPSFPPEDKHRPTIRNVMYNASKVMEMAHNTCQAWFV